MNIVKSYARIVSLNGNQPNRENGIVALQHIEQFGRVSHRSEEAQTNESWDRFIRTVVLGHGDWSIVEHASATVEMVVDRGITHEIVRHRLFSYTQESTRFVNYEKKMPPSFIAPSHILMGDNDESKGSEVWSCPAECAEDWWMQAITQCEKSYQAMLKCGASPQIARSVFPNALASKIIMTGNLRNWRHFFIMRTTKEAHPQMREVTIPLLKEFKEKIPILYEDIEPETKQTISMSMMR